MQVPGGQTHGHLPNRSSAAAESTATTTVRSDARLVPEVKGTLNIHLLTYLLTYKVQYRIEKCTGAPILLL